MFVNEIIEVFLVTQHLVDNKLRLCNHLIAAKAV
jgi:hypothetical protein